MSDNDNLEAYVFHGRNGEEVPPTAEKLIINFGVEDLPFRFCLNLRRLRQVEFYSPPCFSPRLHTIGYEAFRSCHNLHRINLPSTVSYIGESAFVGCFSLTEADLSKTTMKEISSRVYSSCESLQTVILPNTLEQICECAFVDCNNLVTVVVPPDAKPITIRDNSFCKCHALANIMLPKGSTADNESFDDCVVLYGRFGTKSTDIVAGLVGRFDGLSIHRMCYDHSRVTPQELRQCIFQEVDYEFVDAFGMTPFSVLFSTSNSRVDLLEVLLDHYQQHPYRMMNWRDFNFQQPFDYLINDLTDTAATCLEMTIQKCILDRLVNWGAKSWVEAIETRVQALLSESNDRQRSTLLSEVHFAFEDYEKIESMSMLEVALWKAKLKSGWSYDRSKRQTLDQEECRCVCGSDIVIPNVIPFLYDRM